MKSSRPAVAEEFAMNASINRPSVAMFLATLEQSPASSASDTPPRDNQFASRFADALDLFRWHDEPPCNTSGKPSSHLISPAHG
jgi:hypothetical protein